jgi:hypothetical protein
MSVKYDITAETLEAANFRALHAGDDYDHDFTASRDGTALDLDGGKVWLTIKEDSKLADAQAKLQVDSDGTGITITAGPAGEFTVHFIDTETDGLEGVWPYDIKVRLGAAGAAVIRLARGKIEFLPNLTRAIT